MEGLISNIQRFSISDGPGIRTTVFLKGCNLRCFWCHNPECLNSKIELQFFKNKCLQCMKCIRVCPKGVHSFEGEEKVLQREKCTACGRCVKVCPSKALGLSGKYITADDLISVVEKDGTFYTTSGGGITFSGGEPLLQKEFLKEVLMLCKNRGFHTAVESAVKVPWSHLEDIHELVDLFIVDIKTMNPELHKKSTGAENISILENIKRISKLKNELWIRTPIIPGINDNIKSVQDIRSFAAKLNKNTKYELVPFHKLAANKYESLGISYSVQDLEPPTKKLINSLYEQMIF